jgi:hypothetical protein
MKFIPVIILFLSFYVHSFGQENQNFETIINEIGTLENTKDPKCHATAARLEDFMYGTPLNTEARNARIEFQKNYIKHLWLNYSKQLEDLNVPNAVLFKEVEASLIRYSTKDESVEVFFSNGQKINIDNNDLRQYSSVAYALRAILAVDQEFLFKNEKLAPLNQAAITYFKKSIDIAVLSVLKKADE